jgi:hypothetical protein
LLPPHPTAEASHQQEVEVVAAAGVDLPAFLLPSAFSTLAPLPKLKVLVWMILQMQLRLAFFLEVSLACSPELSDAAASSLQS